MREATLFLAASLFIGSAAFPTTTEPSWAPTGRLSQFRGFATPSPLGMPENAQMMYASIWATWSAWSFCSNGVRMRVRACNTVRGFSCLGPNQETRPCDAILPPSGAQKKTTTDYDVVDPWEADRKEAMKQLYPDPDSEGAPQDDNFIQLAPARPGPPALRRAPPRRPQLVDHSLVGFDEHRPANFADGSPGSDPERVFGARQFAVKSVTPEEIKEAKPEEFGSSEINRLVAMSAPLSEEEEKEEIEQKEAFEDITHTTTTTSTFAPETTATQTSTTVSRQLARQRSSGTTKHASLFVSLINQSTGRLNSVGGSVGVDSLQPRLMGQTNRKVQPLGSRRRNLSRIVVNYTTTVLQLPASVVRVNRTNRTTTNKRRLPKVSGEDRDQKISRTIGEEIAKTISMSQEDEEKGTEVLDTSFEEAELVGDSPVRVKPQLSSAAVDDNLEDLLEVADTLVDQTASIPERPTTEAPPVKVSSETDFEGALSSMDETEDFRIRADNKGREMKLVKAQKNEKKKKKNFGITGFALKKMPEDKPLQRLHDGEVSHIQFSAGLAPVVATTTSVTAEETPQISLDTLNALDWMLKNMSQAAAKEDNVFLSNINEAAIGPREEIKESFPIGPSEENISELKPKKNRRIKKKKVKTGKKAELVKLHSGEFAPRTVDRSKMFPKFKARSMKVKKTRALGIRTVNSEKETAQEPTRESLFADVDNPEQIYKEVQQLQAEMQQIEKELKTYNSAERLPRIKALNDPLISDRKAELTKLVKKQPDPLRIFTPMEPVQTETKWGEWSDWGQCRCSIQLRTRVCYYGRVSNGCKGASHQTRLCTGGPCPSKERPTTTAAPLFYPQRTGVFEYNGGPMWPRLQ